MLKIYAFPPLRRIRERRDFQKTFRLGNRLYSPFYTLYHRSNELGYARMGAITKKRSVRKAVQRNRIKRIARETFRLNQSKLKPVDIVLVAQEKANEADNDELKQCLEQLFEKIKKTTDG